MSGPRLQGLIDAIVDEVQTVENAASPVLLYRYINTAYGEQLNTIGDIVGMPRSDRSDTDYRDAIQTKVVLNSSHGEPDTIILACQTYASDSTTIHYAEKTDAEFTLWTDGTFNAYSDYYEAMNSVRPAGVGATLSVNKNIDSTAAFTFEIESGYWDSTQYGAGYAEHDHPEDSTAAGGLAEQLTGAYL